MFEAAELGLKISERAFDAAEPKLRTELLHAQFALAKAGVPVIIVIAGLDGAGKGEFVHRLNEWLDARGLETHAFWETSDEEEERPDYWKFWRALPARGRIAILLGSWYTEPLVQRVSKEITTGELDAALDRIAFFERMLTQDGALLVKLWFHMPKKVQRQMVRELKDHPKLHALMLPSDWKHLKMYDKFRKASERTLRRTDVDFAPWHVIEATDRRYRELTGGKILLKAFKARLKVASSAAKKKRTKGESVFSGENLLAHVDLQKRISDEEYEEELKEQQTRLTELAWRAHREKVTTVAVFEGWDAAGKGSAIRRMTAAIDPRLFRIVSIAAPTDEERAHHYFWRFWRQLPRAGRVLIFDRSWYGRVLVERVEGFAKPEEWERAYSEINDFEEQLTEAGIAVVKFWIHISKDEQLKRFKKRERTPFKRHKINSEDWRNREKWDDYEGAVNEMLTRCSTEFAPWTIVPGNHKRFARVEILKALCARMEKAV